MQLREMRQEELFELLARLRGEAGGSELVVRPELAMQRQQRSGTYAPFKEAEETEGFGPRAAPIHHHADCNDALVGLILLVSLQSFGGLPSFGVITNYSAREHLVRVLASSYFRCSSACVLVAVC